MAYTNTPYSLPKTSEGKSLPRDRRSMHAVLILSRVRDHVQYVRVIGANAVEFGWRVVDGHGSEARRWRRRESSEVANDSAEEVDERPTEEITGSRALQNACQLLHDEIETWQDVTEPELFDVPELPRRTSLSTRELLFLRRSAIISKVKQETDAALQHLSALRPLIFDVLDEIVKRYNKKVPADRFVLPSRRFREMNRT